MNVLLIYETRISIVGGTGTYLKNVVKGLIANGCQVTLAYPEIGGPIEEIDKELKLYPVKVDEKANYRDRTFAFISAINDNLESIIKQNGIEVVHVIFGWYAFAKIDYDKIIRYGAKAFATIHNVPPQECMESFPGDSLTNRLKDFVVNSFRRVRSFMNIQSVSGRLEIVVPCYNVKKRLKRYLCKNRISIIHHGYNEQLVKDVEGIANRGKFTILTVAGIAPGKCQDVLIDAIKDVPERNDMKVVIVGPVRNQNYNNYLKRKIHDNELDQVVDFIDGCSDEELIKLYEMSDLYVQPSRHEGFCLAALDAASMGLKVVGSDVGEIKKIAELSGGLCVDCCNVDEYRDAIRHFFVNRSENDNAKAKMVRQTYNWSKASGELLKLYEK